MKPERARGIAAGRPGPARNKHGGLCLLALLPSFCRPGGSDTLDMKSSLTEQWRFLAPNPTESGLLRAAAGVPGGLSPAGSRRNPRPRPAPSPGSTALGFLKSQAVSVPQSSAARAGTGVGVGGGGSISPRWRSKERRGGRGAGPEDLQILPWPCPRASKTGSCPPAPSGTLSWCDDRLTSVPQPATPAPHLPPPGLGLQIARALTWLRSGGDLQESGKGA